MQEKDIINAIEYLKVQAHDAIEALKQLRRDIEGEKAVLWELHEIRVQAGTLRDLVAAHDAERHAFEHEIHHTKQVWENERKALNRKRELDDAEYRQRIELARVKDSTERARLGCQPHIIAPTPRVLRAHRARIRSKNGTRKIT